MALLKFLKGNYANLNNAAISEGQILVCGDTGELFVDVAADKRVKIGDFITVANLSALEALDATSVPTSRLYYVEEGNILARSNGTSWVQVNKQPTIEELKVQLGLGTMAYKSEVAEGDLNADLAAKINAASGAQHTHTNKDVIDGITAEKVAAWDGAEAAAKAHADGLNTAMNTRVEALEAIDHEHANKALLDTYTQTEADLADAVAKKHAHTFVESELNKIAAGDVAKWNGVVADHLTAANKIAIEDAIGDVSTALENYKTSNNEALAGVRATADAAATKEYTDAELAKKLAKTDYEADKTTFATKTELGDVDAKFASYNTTAAQKAIDDAQDAEIAKKVDKVEGKSLIADSEIARLATLANYDDTQVKADIAKKADAETMATELGKKVDKVTGYSLVSDTEIARLAEVDNYDDAEVRGLIGDNADAIAEIAGDYVKAADIANFETKENVKKVADDLDAYVESNDAAVADRYTKAEADGKFAVKGEDAYDDEEIRGMIADNADAIAAEAERAAGIEGGLRTDVDAIKADYLKAADKTALQEQITANANAINVITNGIDAEKIDGLNDLIEWADEHAPEVKSIKEDIEANAKAISDEATRADEAEKALASRLDDLEAIDHDAYKAADTALHTVISKEIDDDVAAAIAAEVTRSDAKAKELSDAAQAAAIADAASKYETKGTAQGIVNALKLAETYEPIGAETRAVAAAKTETESQVKALAGEGNTSTVKQNADDIATLYGMFQWGEF